MSGVRAFVVAAGLFAVTGRAPGQEATAEEVSVRGASGSFRSVQKRP